METNLIEIAKAEVLEKAKAWAKAWNGNEMELRYDEELIAAVTLLEAREGMKATERLDEATEPAVCDPDHLNPAEGGNRASDDYW